jgi:hypothetical protein
MPVADVTRKKLMDAINHGLGDKDCVEAFARGADENW